MVSKASGQSLWLVCTVLTRLVWLSVLSIVLPNRRRGRVALKRPVYRLWLLFYACPFGAPQFPQAGNFGSRGKMDKCTFCAGGPEEDNSQAEFQKYGSNRIAEGKLPACAEQCATKALLAGDGDDVARFIVSAS